MPADGHTRGRKRNMAASGAELCAKPQGNNVFECATVCVCARVCGSERPDELANAFCRSLKSLFAQVSKGVCFRDAGARGNQVRVINSIDFS